MPVATSVSCPPRQQDSAWKDMLDVYAAEFMEFFYPQFAQHIDWAQGYETLDKELQSITPQASVSQRHVDKLIKVSSRDKQEAQWVLLHIEIQGVQKGDFAQRLFEYYYRLYDRYRQPILQLALLTDADPAWLPDAYRAEVWNTPVLELRFFPVKMLNYAHQPDIFTKPDNPFSLIVEAHLAAEETHRDVNGRYAQKLAFTRRLYERGWGREKILNLYKFLDWLMRLPEDLEIRYNDAIHQLEERKTVSYVTSAERIGIKKGIELGREEGKQEGRQEGEARLLLKILERKFCQIPEDYRNKIISADAELLLIWGERTISASTLEDIFSEGTGQH